MLFFAGLGLCLGGAALFLVADPNAAPWVLPVGSVVTIVSGVLWGIAHGLRGGTASAGKGAVDAAREAGRLGVARIDANRRTGASVNDQPVLEFEVTVASAARPSFRTVLRKLVEVNALHEYAPGTRHAVVLLTPDGPELAFVEDDPSSGPLARVMVPDAASIGEVLPPRRGVVRADGTVHGPLVGAGRRTRWLRVAAYALVVLAVAAVVLHPYRAGVAQTAQALRGGSLRANVLQPEYLSSAVEAIGAKAGTDATTEVTARAGRVDMEVPLHAGQTASDGWHVVRAVVSHEGPSVIQPELAGEQFSARDVAWDKVWPAVRRVAADAGAEPRDVTVIVARTFDDDIDSETFNRRVGPVRVTLSVSGDYGGVSYAMKADGTHLAKLG